MLGGVAGASADEVWQQLAAAPTGDEPSAFDPATLGPLPAPARRWLAAAVPAGTPLHPAVELEMRGEIRLGSWWLPMTGHQLLRHGVGLVWKAVVGGRIMRFVGADALGPDGGSMEFRLHGRVPIVRASGPEVTRSTAGRLAAETVVWLPQSVTPQAGAVWRAIDEERAAVTVPTPVEPVEVEITVDTDGRLTEVCLQRWQDSAKPPAYAPFGGALTAPFDTADGVTVAGAGRVGWQWGTEGQAAGEFFRYELTTVRFVR